MRTTLTFDDELFANAKQYAIQQRSALVNEALRAALHRAAAQCLKLLGGCKASFKLPSKKAPFNIEAASRPSKPIGVSTSFPRRASGARKATGDPRKRICNSF